MKKIIDIAVVLAAGSGSRMRQNSVKNYSKAMTDIKGKQLISYILDAIINTGIKKIIVIRRDTDHLIQSITKLYNHQDVEITFVSDSIKKGSLVSFSFAKDYVECPFLLADCDIICERTSFTDMINSATNTITDEIFATVAKIEQPNSLTENNLIVDDKGHVVGFDKNENTNSVSGGMVYIFLKNPFSLCDEMLKKGIVSYASFFNCLASEEKIKTMSIDQMWDIDTHEDLRTTELLLND